jgi:hypothetical protein
VVAPWRIQRHDREIAAASIEAAVMQEIARGFETAFRC